jgi:serine protease Do
MRTLPKVVASTKVGKDVQLKIWRNRKLITKKLTLGRLESSQEFKEKNPKIKKTKEIEIESLKITVRDLNQEDISSRKLNKDTKGVVIMEISNISPLKGLLNVNDIIIEAQKSPITKSSDLKNIVNEIKKRGDKNLLLSVINENN